KNTPSRLKLAVFASVLISATTALVAPLIIPPLVPNKKIKILSKEREDAYAMPSNPANIPRHASISISLYPYRSHTGPNNNDTVRMPTGIIENKAPDEI